jgi:hypothetical protein
MLGKRMIFWRNLDTCSDKGAGQLSDEVHELLEMMKEQDTMGIPHLGCFFPGIEYVFSDTNNKNLQNREIKNHTCVGVKIVLHEDEDPDDLSLPYRILKHPPTTIFVKPDGPLIGNISKGVAGCPSDCFPISFMARSFNVKWEGPPKQLFKDSFELGNSILVKRRGIKLSLAYCVTDYFAQGMSFKGKPWLIHLTLPDKHPSFDRANILVPLSRPSRWSELKLITPLWPQGDSKAREKFINKVHQALKPSLDYKEEMKRAKALATGREMRALYLKIMKREMP